MAQWIPFGIASSVKMGSEEVCFVEAWMGTVEWKLWQWGTMEGTVQLRRGLRRGR